MTIEYRRSGAVMVVGMVIACLVSAASWKQVASAADRDDAPQRAWKKDDPKNVSYFVPMGTKRWTEVHENGSKLSFVETKRSAGQVELYDQGRNMRIRLGAKFAEISVNGQPFQRWLNGSWQSMKSLPDYARMAPIDYRLRLIYFVPTDRQPTQNYEAKIRCVMAFVNSLYKQEFERRGWDARGLQFQLDDQQRPIVHLIRGQHAAAYYSGSPNYEAHRQYARIQPEIPSSLGAPANQLVVAFMETYDPGPHSFEWPGGVALGGRYSADGGLGIFSAWILQDEFCASTVKEQVALFNDSTPIKGRTALGHGRPDSPRFEFIEDGFGAVIHEVGHALGLPHDQRDDQHDIMGNGFRKLRVNLSKDTPIEQRARFSDANANMLHYSRHLNPDIDLTDGTGPEVSAKVTAADSPEVQLEFTARDAGELGAYLVIDGSNGNVLMGEALEGKESTKKLRVAPNPKKGSSPLLRVLVSDRSGNHAQVDADR